MFQTSTEFFTKLGQWATINNIRLYILQEKDSVAKSSPELHYNKGIVSVNIYSFWSFNMITQFCKIGLECSSINSVKICASNSCGLLKTPLSSDGTILIPSTPMFDTFILHHIGSFLAPNQKT